MSSFPKKKDQSWQFVRFVSDAMMSDDEDEITVEYQFDEFQDSVPMDREHVIDVE